MPICSRRRASERALVISLAVASLVIPGEAFGQVRSTIHVQARVVEAGPAWAASEAVREALAAARALSPSYEYSGGRVVSIGYGDGLDGVPVPRVNIVSELATIRATLRSFGGERVAELGGRDRAVGGSTNCSLFTSGAARALGGVPFALLPRSDEPQRLIVYVEYISN